MIRLIMYYIVFALHIIFWNGLLAAEERSCSNYDARKQNCGDFEQCVGSVCGCLSGYTRLNDKCVKNTPNPLPSPQPAGHSEKPFNDNNSHVAVAIIVPIMLILFIIGGVVIVRRYRLIGWVRSKLNQRETPYDEVMIGQDDDDPPLSGV